MQPAASSDVAHANTPTNPAPKEGLIWRVVEGQHQISTMKLVDSTDEQQLLEELLDDTKPPVPQDCRHLHYLLFTPFRYSKYPSRFRKPNDLYGVYYGAEAAETALAEISFHRLLRFADAPTVPWPTNPINFTAFSARFKAAKCVDLTAPPYLDDAAKWTDPHDYSACQALGADAHKGGVDAIRSTSIRDPQARHNISLLTCKAFPDTEPVDEHIWRVRFSQTGVQAICTNPSSALTFKPDAFARDPRMKTYPWARP